MAKIIANTDLRHVLVEMTKNEIAQLMGHSSLWNLNYDAEKAGRPRPTDDDLFGIGTEIPIDPMWQLIDKLTAADRTFNGVAGELRKAAEWLDTIPSILEPATPKRKTKEPR
jgi:hypothetical protein